MNEDQSNWRRRLPRGPHPEWARCRCGEMAENHLTDGTCPGERDKRFRRPHDSTEE